MVELSPAFFSLLLLCSSVVFVGSSRMAWRAIRGTHRERLGGKFHIGLASSRTKKQLLSQIQIYAAPRFCLKPPQLPQLDRGAVGLIKTKFFTRGRGGDDIYIVQSSSYVIGGAVQQ